MERTRDSTIRPLADRTEDRLTRERWLAEMSKIGDQDLETGPATDTDSQEQVYVATGIEAATDGSVATCSSNSPMRRNFW